MSWATAILIISAIGFLLFALRLIIGIGIDERGADENYRSRFELTIGLWRNVINRIDEMTRRHVVELGSVRKRLADIVRSTGHSRVPDASVELTEYTRRLERHIQDLRSRLGSVDNQLQDITNDAKQKD